MTAAIENQFSVKVENKYAFLLDCGVDDDPTDILSKIDKIREKAKDKSKKARTEKKAAKDVPKVEIKTETSAPDASAASTQAKKGNRKDRVGSASDTKNQIPRFNRDEVNKENDEPQSGASAHGRGFGRGGFGKPGVVPDDSEQVAGEGDESSRGFGRGRGRGEGRGRGFVRGGGEFRGRGRGFGRGGEGGGGFGRGGGEGGRGGGGEGGFSRGGGFGRGGGDRERGGRGFGRGGRGRGGFAPAHAEEGVEGGEETDRPATGESGGRGGGGFRGRGRGGGFNFAPRNDAEIEDGGEMGEGEEREGGRGRGRGRGKGRGGGRGFGRGSNRGREYERHSGSATTGVKPTEKRDGAGSHNWGTVQDDLEEQLAEPAVKTEDWAEAVESEQINAAGEAATPMYTLEEWRRQQKEDRAKLVTVVQAEPSRQVDKAAFRDMTAYRKERLQEAEESDDEDEHHHHQVLRKSEIETNFFVNLNNPQANYDDSRMARRGGGRGRGRGAPRGSDRPERGSRGGGRGRGGQGSAGQQASFRLDEDFPELS